MEIDGGKKNKTNKSASAKRGKREVDLNAEKVMPTIGTEVEEVDISSYMASAGKNPGVMLPREETNIVLSSGNAVAPIEEENNLPNGEIENRDVIKRNAELSTNVVSHLGTAEYEYADGKAQKPIPQWLYILITVVLCLIVGISSSLITAYIVKSSGVDAPDITIENKDTPFSAAVKLLEKNIVEVSASTNHGTGFIVYTNNGTAHIITNYHVVSEGIASIRYYNMSRFAAAQIIGYSSKYDIAILSASAPSYSPYNLIDSQYMDCKFQADVGEELITLGNALGLGVVSAQTGILSARAVMLSVSNINESGTKVVPVVRTSVAINAGISGAPVFTAEGKIAGVATYRHITNGDEVIDNTSYYVPIGTAIAVYKHVVNNIKTASGEAELIDMIFVGENTEYKGSITIPDFGLTLGCKDGNLVVASSSDASIGVRAGDVITAIDGVSIIANDYCTVTSLILGHSSYGKGDALTFTVNGAEVALSAYRRV